MTWPWTKKKAVIPPPTPKVLTGIEKHWLEVAQQEKAAAQAKWEAERAEICRQIAEIEKAIGPQLARLDQLRAQINPLSNSLAHMMAQSNPYTQWPAMGLGNSLLGLLGAAAGGFPAHIHRERNS